LTNTLDTGVDFRLSPHNLPGKKVFYKSAVVEDTTISLGDYVSMAPDTPDIPPYIGRIISMFTKGGDNMLHVYWLK
jgi:hypothetical protein